MKYVEYSPRAAYAAWSYLTEAGDLAATLLISQYGAQKAIHWVLEQCERVDHGLDLKIPLDSCSPQEWRAAFKRWHSRLHNMNLSLVLKMAAEQRIQLLIPGDEAWPFDPPSGIVSAAPMLDFSKLAVSPVNNAISFHQDGQSEAIVGSTGEETDFEQQETGLGKPATRQRETDGLGKSVAKTREIADRSKALNQPSVLEQKVKTPLENSNDKAAKKVAKKTAATKEEVGGSANQFLEAESGDYHQGLVIRGKNRGKTDYPHLVQTKDSFDKLPALPVGGGKVSGAVITHSLPGIRPRESNGQYYDAGPFCLWYLGNPELLTAQYCQVAVVGSRAMSDQAEQVTYQLARGLAKEGCCIVSGGAYGVDITAHRGVLSVGGKTISVLAGGLDRLYPAMNQETLELVAKNGLLISQYPPGTRPARWRFLARNRLIAALSEAVIVIEAGIRSGSLNTAKHAREMGKHLGVVPGNVLSPNWFGSNQLIRDGATLIRNHEDVMEMVQPLGERTSYYPAKPSTPLDQLNQKERMVYDALPGSHLATVETLIQETALDVREISIALASLCLEGYVKKDAGRWRRAVVGQP